MNKLNPEKKRLWLEALRSEKYKQGHCRLKGDSSFCCLGVYADAVEHVEWIKDHILGYVFLSNHTEQQVSTLPYEMVDSEAQGQLIYMNDEMNESFDYIANWIKENL